MTADTLLSLPALLDTDIFSEFLRGRNATVARRAAAYETVHAHFTVSAVTLLEVVSGWQRRGLPGRRDFQQRVSRGREGLYRPRPTRRLGARVRRS